MDAEAKAGEGELRLGEQPGKRNAKYTGSFFSLLEVLTDALRLAGEAEIRAVSGLWLCPFLHCSAEVLCLKH